MSSEITTEALVRWCRVPHDRLVDHPERRAPLRVTLGSVQVYEPAHERDFLALAELQCPFMRQSNLEILEHIGQYGRTEPDPGAEIRLCPTEEQT